MMTREAPADGHQLNETEWLTLRALADAIVPPSARYGIPGAGDAAIAKTIVKDAKHGDKLPRLIRGLAALEDMAQAAAGAAFAALEESRRETVAFAFRGAHPADATLAEQLVTQCYYRDDRVVASLGMELRPPMPEGYKVDQGDWSLLEQVQKRQPFHRPAG
jgi:hypothetical protein